MGSGDLNGEHSVSSEIGLRVDSSRGGFLQFWYKASVSWPYDRFVVTMNGEEEFVADSPTRNPPRDPWMRFDMFVPAGEATLALRVETYPEWEGGDFSSRDPEGDGEGFVYVDDFKFYATTYR